MAGSDTSPAQVQTSVEGFFEAKMGLVTGRAYAYMDGSFSWGQLQQIPIPVPRMVWKRVQGLGQRLCFKQSHSPMVQAHQQQYTSLGL